MNNDKKWGGAREGAGRPPSGRKPRRFNLNDRENELLREIAEIIRTPDGLEMTEKLYKDLQKKLNKK